MPHSVRKQSGADFWASSRISDALIVLFISPRLLSRQPACSAPSMQC
jgi:hypothetical protein